MGCAGHCTQALKSSQPACSLKSGLAHGTDNKIRLDSFDMGVQTDRNHLEVSMADGTFAVLLLIAGLSDMQQNYCSTPNGCLGKTEAEPRFSVSVGNWVERAADPQGEIYVRYDFDHKLGPFGVAAGLSVAENGETWIGFGQTYGWENDGFFAELHALTGLYFDNGGFDLGHPIEFRSGIELGYETKAGWRFGLGYDHRSNTGIFANRNPGVETVHVRVGIPTRRILQ
jgi:lipid A 3-O-deacylase